MNEATQVRVLNQVAGLGGLIVVVFALMYGCERREDRRLREHDRLVFSLNRVAAALEDSAVVRVNVDEDADTVTFEDRWPK